MAKPTWGAGHVVAEKYRLVDKLGEGGMGVVWRADHVTLRSPVAIKFVTTEALTSEEAVKRFLHEAQAAAMLRSPHVVQILDHGVEDGVPYMAMELLEGESLATRLARLGPLSIAQTTRLITHVARAITKAHEAGIIHRDLKPDNIFLVTNDDEEVAKVLDFGIAKVTNGLAEATSSVSTRTGALLGTPYYMSPEQVRGHKLDFRTDLWSLAVIAFECVTGGLPFRAETVGDLLLQVCTAAIPTPSSFAETPPGFDIWFAKGVARDKEKRFQSAREMAEALRAIAGEEVGAGGRFSMSGESAAPFASSRSPLARSGEQARKSAESAETIVAPIGAPQAPNLETIGGSSVAAISALGATAQGKRSRRVIAGVAATLALAGICAWEMLSRSTGSVSPAPMVAATPVASSSIAPPSPPAPTITVSPATASALGDGRPPPPAEPAPSGSSSPVAKATPLVGAGAASKRRATPVVVSAAGAAPPAPPTKPAKKDELAF